MTQTISDEKVKFVKDYIDSLENDISVYNENIFLSNDENFIFDDIREVISVFQQELPELNNSVIFRNGTAVCDANTVIAILKKYLIDNGYVEKNEKHNIIDRFWLCYFTYFQSELPKKDYLKDQFVTLNGNDEFCININLNYQFSLHYGLNYEVIDFSDINNIKLFIELSFSEWIKPDKRYEYTKDINKMFKKMKLPFKLSKGKIISETYKTSTIDEIIIDYAMFERKIQFADEMILSKESLDKKSALDYIVDSLQYLISIQKGEKLNEKYSNAALSVCKDKRDKEYSVITTEIKEVMKIVNEYFDIRHNEYLNKSNEIRQSISDPWFIEYLYNRIYSLLRILKLNYKK